VDFRPNRSTNQNVAVVGIDGSNDGWCETRSPRRLQSFLVPHPQFSQHGLKRLSRNAQIPQRPGIPRYS